MLRRIGSRDNGGKEWVGDDHYGVLMEMYIGRKGEAWLGLVIRVPSPFLPKTSSPSRLLGLLQRLKP